MLSFAARSEILRKARAIFVKHWTDLGRLSVHISGSSIHIHGTLERLPGVTAELTPAIVDAIFSEMARLPDSPRLDVDLDNWEQSSPTAGWRPKSKGIKPVVLPHDDRASTSKVYNYDKKPRP